MLQQPQHNKQYQTTSTTNNRYHPQNYNIVNSNKYYKLQQYCKSVQYLPRE